MYHSKLPIVVLLVVAGVASAQQTGFEVSDGFEAGNPWPTGWSGDGVVSTANPASGAQSIQMAASQDMKYTANLPITEPTMLSVDICPGTHNPSKAENFLAYGHMYVYRQDYYFAGGVNFSLNDADDSLGGTEFPSADEYQIIFWNTSGGAAEVVGQFSPGTWYRYSLLIDPTAGTTTHTLTLLNGTPVAQRTYSNAVSSIPQVNFYGTNASSGAAYIDNAYIGEPIPEPAMMGLLGLGSLLMLRRR
jgi:MYXO-CTERM domain-containing protein